MPFLSGKLAARRFQLTEVDGVDHSPDSITGALNGAAFNNDQTARMKAGDVIRGWAYGDGFQTDFEADGRQGWLFNHYALFFLRIDELKIPGAILKRRRRELEAKWCEDNGREKVPSGVKRELKMQAEDELAPKTHPTTKLIPVLWETSENIVYVHTFATSSLDTLRSAFRGSFSGRLEAITAVNAMATVKDADAPTLDQTELYGPDQLASDFYLWLWYTTDDDGGTLDLDGEVYDAWVESKVVLASEGDTTTLKAENINEVEISASLRRGKAFTAIGLHLRREEREYEILLQGGELDIRSAKLPPCAQAGDDELLYERAYLIEDLHFIVMKFYKTFLLLRLDDDKWGPWYAKVRKRIESVEAK